MGVLRHFDEASNQLKDLYFIDPAWLCHMLAQVATVEEINPYISKSGVSIKHMYNRLFLMISITLTQMPILGSSLYIYSYFLIQMTHCHGFYYFTMGTWLKG